MSVERIVMRKGRDEFRVAPRGVEKLLKEGWERIGNPQALTPEVTPVDSGPIKVRAPRKTK
jgi:hypothetical protein